MVRKIIYLIIFLLLIRTAFAMYGGDTEVVFHFDRCSSLVVDVSSAYIDDEEYSFLNCSQMGGNKWSCDCYDGFDLIIFTDVRTVNKYDITATYSYEGEEEVVKISGGGGGGNTGGGGGGTAPFKGLTTNATASETTVTPTATETIPTATAAPAATEPQPTDGMTSTTGAAVVDTGFAGITGRFISMLRGISSTAGGLIAILLITFIVLGVLYWYNYQPRNRY